MNYPFSNTVPPLAETFSFRNRRPCRFEECTNSLERNDKEPCPFSEVCDMTSKFLSSAFYCAYGYSLRVTLSEPSSNIVSRSEGQYHRGERSRLSLRKHIYEMGACNPDIPYRPLSKYAYESICRDLNGIPAISSPKVVALVDNLLKPLLSPQDTAWRASEQDYSRTPLWKQLLKPIRDALKNELPKQESDRVFEVIVNNWASPLNCHPFFPSMQPLERYIGFVDLRMHAGRSPVAVAVIAPPRALRHDPKVYLACGEYGQLFGSHAFSGTVFCMHDVMASGARCAQACVTMCLGNLADRGTKLVGGYDLTYWANRNRKIGRRNQDGECLRDAADALSVFPITGLDPYQSKCVLEQGGAGAHLVHMRSSAVERSIMSRLFVAYLMARYPAVLFVDACVWQQMSEKPETRGHAVLAIGFRRTSTNINGGRACIGDLVLHDPGRGPYVVRSVHDVFEAMTSFYNKQLMFAVFATQSKIRRSGLECLEALKRTAPGNYQRFIVQPALLAESHGPHMPHDYDLSLLHHADIPAAISNLTLSQYYQDRHAIHATQDTSRCGATDGRIYETVRAQVSQVRTAWYWVVTLRLLGRPIVAYLFDSSDGSSFPIPKEIFPLTQTATTHVSSTSSRQS